nr:cobalamin-binding protein [Desulfobacula sp.]
MAELNGISKDFVNALLRIDGHGCSMLLKTLSAQEEGLVPLEDVVIPALEHIGLAWEEGRISLSQVYMAGRICEKVVGDVLSLERPSLYDRPRLAIGVIGDYHALGKRMVLSVLRSSGFNLLDYGHGLQPLDLIEKTIRDKVDILLLSCLMLTSAMHVKGVTAGLKKAGSRTVVVVGGAPFRLAPLLWKEVGAHYMGRNSGEAVSIVQAIMGNRTWA